MEPAARPPSPEGEKKTEMWDLDPNAVGWTGTHAPSAASREQALAVWLHSDAGRVVTRPGVHGRLLAPEPPCGREGGSLRRAAASAAPPLSSLTAVSLSLSSATSAEGVDVYLCEYAPASVSNFPIVRVTGTTNMSHEYR